jgi:ribosomal protein L13E
MARKPNLYVDPEGYEAWLLQKAKALADKKLSKPWSKLMAKKVANGKTTRGFTLLETTLLGIVKDAKGVGITVNAAAKKLYGKRFAEIARPNQAIYFKVDNVNIKLAAQGKKMRIKKKNPGPGPGKQIVIALSRT